METGVMIQSGPKPNAAISNKNIIMCSFKSSGDIQKKEGGPEGGVSYSQTPIMPQIKFDCDRPASLRDIHV